jgi:hypothetical protein
MRTKLLCLALMLNCFFAFAQKKEKNTDNYTYIKLFITNGDNKVLLLKWGTSWEVPGARYAAPFTITKFIDTLAGEDGIDIKDVRLSGIFSVQYEGQKKVAVMQYYSANYKSGNIRVPAGCSDIKWHTVEDALKLISAEDMKIFVGKISEDKNVVWGASVFKRSDNKTDKPQIEITEPFYKLN